jgi:hypothetical protein
MSAGKDDRAVSVKPAAPVERISESFTNWLQRAAAMNEGHTGSDVANAQLDKLLTATDLDEIMDADEQGTYQLRDLVGIELEIPPPGFPDCVRKSAEKFDSTLGAYIQFNATALTDYTNKGTLIPAGAEMLISTGAPLVVGKLRSMEANGYLPFKFLVTGIEATNGTVLKLRRQSRRA